MAQTPMINYDDRAQILCSLVIPEGETITKVRMMISQELQRPVEKILFGVASCDVFYRHEGPDDHEKHEKILFRHKSCDQKCMFVRLLKKMVQIPMINYDDREQILCSLVIPEGETIAKVRMMIAQELQRPVEKILLILFWEASCDIFYRHEGPDDHEKHEKILFQHKSCDQKCMFVRLLN